MGLAVAGVPKSSGGQEQRDVERKLTKGAFARHRGKLVLPERLVTQKCKTKGKVYSLSAPEVESIPKGKAHLKPIV